MSYQPAHNLASFLICPFVKRSAVNPTWPKPPTPEMVQVIDAEAVTAFANNKRNIKSRSSGKSHAIH